MITAEIQGETVRFIVNEKTNAVSWSDNWEAIVSASANEGDFRFSRKDFGGPFGSVAVIYSERPVEESLAVVIRSESTGLFDISLPMTVEECRAFIAKRPEKERGRLSWRSA